MMRVISRALHRSASSPVCLIECLLDIARGPLHLAYHLLRNTFRLLSLVASHLSDRLLELACNLPGSAFQLIEIHGVPLKRGSCV